VESVFSPSLVRVERWALEGPFPDRVAALPHTAPGPWGALLAEAVEQRAGLVVPTEAMHCVARELGRFYLAHRARPDDGLQGFIVARCHATVAQVGFGYVDGAASRSVPEAQLFEHWKPGVVDTIRKSASGGARAIGIWFGRSDDHAVVMVAYGTRRVRVEPFSPFAGRDAAVEFEGETLVPAVALSALVNQGRFGVAACEPDSEVQPPRFRFRCPVDRGDVSAHIALTLKPPNRLLGQAGLQVLAFPGKRTQDVYELPRHAQERRVESFEEVPESFVELLNEVRREAGLGPVQLDPLQSAAAAKLAPHFFAAVFQRAPEVAADLAVLGMVAGWSVDGVVRSGYFASSWVLRTTDVGELLARALESPSNREALLADDIDRIAVGPLFDATQGRESVAAVIGTYALFTGEAHGEFAAQVYEKLEADRREHGLGAPERLEQLEGLCHEAAGWVSSGEDPADAMNALLQRGVDVLRAPVSGWVAEVRDLDDLDFPLEYRTSPTVRVAVAVSHRKRPDEPWGHYVVMLVVSDPEAWGA
jgi:hypothetical protein